MEQFLASVERRAFTIARLAVGDADEALDIVQDSMLSLVKSYRHRPEAEWRPLFFSILQNRVTDWHRRHKRISRWQLLREKLPQDGEDELWDPGDLPDPHGERPEQEWLASKTMEAVERAVGALPLRQQQAFMLRCVEGFDVAETARAMSCSDGSVKTHLSRALKSLRNQLEELR